MQINPDIKIEAPIPSGNGTQLKEGDLSTAIVKERLPQNEALLQVKGQVVKAKVEGELPQAKAISIEVVSTSSNPLVVRVVDSAKPARSLPALPQVNQDVKTALQLLNQNGTPITRKTIEALNQFFKETKGTPEQKLETISSLLKKGLDMTANQLKTVHSAIHDHSYSKTMDSLVKGLDPSFGSKGGIERPFQQIMKVLNAIEHRLSEGDKALLGSIRKEFAATVDVSGAVKKLQSQFGAILRLMPQEEMKLTNLLRQQMSTGVQAVPDRQSASMNPLQKALQDMQTLMRKEANTEQLIQKLSVVMDATPDLPHTAKTSFEQSLVTAQSLDSEGRELKAREEIAKGVAALQSHSGPAADSAPQIAVMQQEDWYEGIPAHSKLIMVETVTKKMSQLSMDFKQTKNEVSLSLQQVLRLINGHKQMAEVSAKPLLENTINKLDGVLLRGDFMLYADMKTEKKLLNASTQLAQAKQLLSKGDMAAAKQIVESVKQEIDRLQFKPSEIKVKNFVEGEWAKMTQTPSDKRGLQNLEQAMHAVKQEPTARSAFELIRSAGLTRESDQAMSLLARDKNQDPPANLKDLLLKMTRHEDAGVSSKAEGMLGNLTGQQLMSKTDSSGLQTMMFTLPYLLQDKVEGVKVYINSKADQQKVDWQNCSLFFLFDTKKYGEVGISLTASERNLSIQVKNDQEGFSSRMEPLAEKAKDRLEQIGYTISKLQFSPLNRNEEEPREEKKASAPRMNEKGYDFTI
ncbi:hypothetical protein ACNA6I_16875 [Rossellomorea sp. FS2]|uniref:hypothetical protein n=1 Tax=Rossellomorea sp. FS2 TaxID=3391447 RepID=UPI003A4DBC88